jgi:hypothetical protein
MWTNDTEISFFEYELQRGTDPEQLFYCFGAAEYFAYIPKNRKEKKPALQSRNSLIGGFTEKWVRDLLAPIAESRGLFAVNTVECKELGLVKKSEADVAFCTTNTKLQKPEHVKLIFEVKMSVVSNYLYDNKDVKFFGNHTTHRGQPSLLRSDSMLKAAGKAINIRVSGLEASTIPIVILGNSPISKGYDHKVDFLKNAGVIQSFISLSSQPTGEKQIQQSKHLGFQTVQDVETLQKITNDILSSDAHYFSSMLPKSELGEIIRVANEEKTDVAKAEKFLSLIRRVK